MSCPKRAMVSAYLDGELTPKQTHTLQKHLEGCRECSQAYQEFQRLGTLLSERRPEELPGGFINRLEARIEGVREASAPWRRLELTAKRLVPAFVFLLLIAGLLSFFPGPLSGTGSEALANVFADASESEFLFINYPGEAG